MSKENILLIGGSGKLGTELQKHLDVHAPTHREFDINRDSRFYWNYDLVIHAAAYTNVLKAEREGLMDCWRLNVDGTENMLEMFGHLPFVFISSEYAKDPVNFYGYTKQAGEDLVRKMSPNHLIFRTLFKPRPFPHPQAFLDQYTQGDYVDVIAELIVAHIHEWDRKTSATIYPGTGRKTMFDLARMTRPSVVPCSVNDIKGVRLPKDYL